MSLSSFLGWRPHWFIDTTVLREEGSSAQGRRLTYLALERPSNNFSVVLVSSLGFFTSSYLLFSSTEILPMLGFVYWYDAKTPAYVTAFNNATVAGCILGMLSFGFLADRFGRRKLYGWELITLVIGTMGVVMSSAGYLPSFSGDKSGSTSIMYKSYGSMNIESWLLFWRVVSGIGIGGEFPLSAVIASEYAPTKSRPRLLATVFAMRPFAIASGALVSLLTTFVLSKKHPYDADNPQASARAIDQAWRWVTGLGLVPATITAIIRFTVPESPRYTLDVLNDPGKASAESCRLKNSEHTIDFEQGSKVGHPVSLDNPSKSHHGQSHHVQLEITSDDQVSLHAPENLTVREYFWTQGNWRTLVATSLSWFLVDLSLFADGLNEPKTLGIFWYGSSISSKSGGPKPASWNSTPNTTTDIFKILMGNSYHLLAIETIASVIGSVLLVLTITRINRKLLTWVMLLVSGALFMVLGATLAASAAKPQVVGIDTALFALAKFCKFFGAGPLTFMLPAELFPTKWRASCHAISAASGKLGAVLASIILYYGTFGRGRQFQSSLTWLGYVYMTFSVPLFLGAVVTWLWLPELQDHNGASKTLEQLAKGRAPNQRQNRTESALAHDTD